MFHVRFHHCRSSSLLFSSREGRNTWPNVNFVFDILSLVRNGTKKTRQRRLTMIFRRSSKDDVSLQMTLSIDRSLRSTILAEYWLRLLPQSVCYHFHQLRSRRLSSRWWRLRRSSALKIYWKETKLRKMRRHNMESVTTYNIQQPLTFLSLYLNLTR